MKKLIVLCLILFGSAAAVTVFAADSAFDELSQAVKKKTVEKMTGSKHAANAIKGNVTGGACKAAADCIVGCKTGQSEVTCISRGQGSAACVSSAHPAPPGGLACTCLSSVSACGYAFP